MRKLIALIVLVMMAGVIVTGCGSTGTKAPAKNKIVIGLDDSFPPMGFRDEKNNIIHTKSFASCVYGAASGRGFFSV